MESTREAIYQSYLQVQNTEYYAFLTERLTLLRDDAVRRLIVAASYDEVRELQGRIKGFEQALGAMIPNYE